MAGRGAIPVELSPDYIEAIRYQYVETDRPVREICAEFAISLGKLHRLGRKHGWPRRMDRPPRELPPALKLREESRKLVASTLPPRSGGGALHLSQRERSASGATAVEVAAPLSASSCPGLTRASTSSCADSASKAWMAGSSPAMTPEPAATAEQTAADAATVSISTEDAIARLEALVLKEIAAEEAVQARLGNAPRTRAEAEKSARTLSLHAQTWQNLQRLRAGAAGAAPTQPGPTDHDDDRFDDLPADLDEFRRALAQRIEAFVASQPDDEMVDDATGDIVPAGRA